MAKLNVNPPQLTVQEIQRFWTYVDKSPGQGPKGDCWKWTRGISSNGYGRFGRIREGWSTHRLAFFLSKGYWPLMLVCHTCDWKPCCNPSHLFAGTSADNLRDMSIKGRAARMQGEKSGRSKLKPAQVLEIRKLCAEGRRNHPAIAKQFGVSRPLVTLIANRKTWKHI